MVFWLITLICTVLLAVILFTALTVFNWGTDKTLEKQRYFALGWRKQFCKPGMGGVFLIQMNISLLCIMGEDLSLNYHWKP